MQWTLGVVGLIAYSYTIHRGATPIGEVAVGAAVAGMLFMGGKFRAPTEWVLHAVFMGIAIFGIFSGRYPDTTAGAVQEGFKLSVIFLVACNVLRTPAHLRLFIFAWLFLFAFFPMRGAFVNYMNNNTVQGRVAWNFAFANPNDLAGMCLMPMAMCAGVLATERKGLIWLGAAVQMFGLVVVVLLTQSRGAAVALGVLLLLMLIIQRPRPRTLAVYAVLMAVIASVAPSRTWDRLATLLKIGSSADMAGVDEEGSAEQRYAIWKVARAIISDFPITGIGYGAYGLVHREYARSPDLPSIAKGARDTHSTYLNALAENGVIGLTFLVCAWLLAFRRTLRAVKKIRAWSPPIAMQLQFLGLGFAAFLVAGIWGTYQKFAFTWIYVAILFLFEAIYVPLAEAAVAGAGGAMAPAPIGVPRRSGRVGR